MPVALDEAEQLVTEHEWRALLRRDSEESLGDLPVGPADTDLQHSNRHLAGERTHIRDFGDPRRARPPWLCDERMQLLPRHRELYVCQSGLGSGRCVSPET